MDTKKVLLVYSGYFAHGGAETFIYNWVKNAPTNKYGFTWYSPFLITDKEYIHEFEKIGIKVISGGLPYNKIRAREIKKMREDIGNILKSDTYSIVHINTGTLLAAAIASWLAKENGISQRIVHSHSGGALTSPWYKKGVQFILRLIINKYTTQRVACSKIAGESLFGKKYVDKIKLINNSINAETFAFSVEARDKVRERLSLQNCYVFGQVARLTFEKNQKFLIDVFKHIYATDKSSRLLLAGAGPLEEELKQYAKEIGIADIVIFAGSTDVPQDYYCAMDMFLLPSLFEGLPIVGVEAQTAGLPCVFSEAVTREVDITGRSLFLSLSLPAEDWADRILSLRNSGTAGRTDAWKHTCEVGYDVSNIPAQMDELYGGTRKM